jgi:hypothetical protein
MEDITKSTTIKHFSQQINDANSPSYTYWMVTEDPLAVVEVKTTLFCSIS